MTDLWHGSTSIATLVLASFFFAAPARCVAAEKETAVEQAERAVKLARDGKHEKALVLLRAALDKAPDSAKIRGDYVVVLSWASKHEQAVAQFNALPEKSEIPVYVRRAAAKSFRHIGGYEKAELLYRELVENSPHDADLVRGLALTLADAGQEGKAFAALAQAISRIGDNPSLFFAKASLHWKKRQYLRAIDCYEKILEIEPENRAARNLKTRTLSDMGAVSLAKEYAQSVGVTNRAILRRLGKRRAASHINWGEPEVATNILMSLMENYPAGDFRDSCRFDLILALHSMNEMEAVTNIYEKLESRQVETPFWAQRAAAGAYLYLREPSKAEDLYRMAVLKKPDDFDARMGLFYTCIETSRYKEAGRIRSKLDRETPEWIWDRGVLRYNWQKDRVVTSEGWWLAYQDRNKRAGTFFSELLRRAPANLSCRTGLGHVHLWRGWPHRALEDFDIIITRGGEDPLEKDRPPYAPQREIAARNGRLVALNQCYLKKKARKEATRLLEENPENLHTKRIKRSFEIEDSTKFYLDAVVTDEDPGVGEYSFYSSLTQPLDPFFDLYVFYLERETESDQQTGRHERAGAGFTWDVLPVVTVSSEVSADMEEQDKPGIVASVEYRLDDYWRFSARHTTYSLDVPLRARAEGVEGTRTSLNAGFRASDRFSVGAAAGYHDLDDGNKNYLYGLFSEHSLWTRAHWKTSLELEATGSHNTKTNLPYFSPEYDYTLAATHTIDHTVYRRWDYAFVHRLHTGIGIYNQTDYDPETIWHIRYEHDYLITDWTSFLWGYQFSRRYYDGEPVDFGSWYLTLRKTF